MSYSPILLPADLNSVLYPEIQAEITRGDGGALATEAIDTAIQEAKMYLTRYDLVQLFGDPTVTVANPTGIAATFFDSYLKRMLKDMATWHLIQLANLNISYEAAQARYDEAIDSLKRIQKGMAAPQWPDIDTTLETSKTPDNIVSYADPKRSNNY